jgi:predicted RNA-binding Zn-ribbon protein involved in translation (DUF1610 family)
MPYFQRVCLLTLDFAVPAPTQWNHRTRHWEARMTAGNGGKKHPQIPLKIIMPPGIGNAISAPPVLTASSHTIDYTCGKCGTILMRAELGQVHNVLIHCTKCGAYNSTDS